MSRRAEKAAEDARAAAADAAAKAADAAREAAIAGASPGASDARCALENGSLESVALPALVLHCILLLGAISCKEATGT